MIRILLIAIGLLFFTSPSVAGYIENPDERTSITVTGGIGDLEGLNSDRTADLHVLGVALVYPTSPDFSLLATYNYAESEWNGFASRCNLEDWNTKTFTIGFRFYIGH